jgi:hypothetical protein
MWRKLEENFFNGNQYLSLETGVWVGLRKEEK